MFSGLVLAAAVIVFTAYGTAPDRMYDRARQPAEISVTYGELDLESQAGAEVLLRRIERAAAKSCGDAPRPAEMWKHNPFRECVRAAMDRAVYRLDEPLVKELYERNKAGEERQRQTVSQE